MLEVGVEGEEDYCQPRNSTMLKRISKMPIEKNRSSKRATRVTKFGVAFTEQLAEQVYN